MEPRYPGLYRDEVKASGYTNVRSNDVGGYGFPPLVVTLESYRGGQHQKLVSCSVGNRTPNLA